MNNQLNYWNKKYSRMLWSNGHKTYDLQKLRRDLAPAFAAKTSGIVWGSSMGHDWLMIAYGYHWSIKKSKKSWEFLYSESVTLWNVILSHKTYDIWHKTLSHKTYDLQKLRRDLAPAFAAKTAAKTSVVIIASCAFDLTVLAYSLLEILSIATGNETVLYWVRSQMIKRQRKNLFSFKMADMENGAEIWSRVHLFSCLRQ